jgi:hypothetical protein
LISSPPTYLRAATALVTSMGCLIGCGGAELLNTGNVISTASVGTRSVIVGASSANQNALIAYGMNGPYRVFSDRTRLFISDTGNNRVLIYNSIPTSSLTLPSVVLGQPNLNSNILSEGGDRLESRLSSRDLCGRESTFRG